MTSPLSPDIAEGRRLLDAATPGPWRTMWDDHQFKIIAPCETTPDGEQDIGEMIVWDVNSPEGRVNALIAAWSRNNLPALLDRLEAAEARVRELEAAQPRLVKAALKRAAAYCAEHRREVARDLVASLALKPCEIAAIVAAGTEAQP